MIFGFDAGKKSKSKYRLYQLAFKQQEILTYYYYSTDSLKYLANNFNVTFYHNA